MPSESRFVEVKSIIFSCVYNICIGKTEDKKRNHAVDFLWITTSFFIMGIGYNIISLISLYLKRPIVWVDSDWKFLIGFSMLLLLRLLIEKIFKKSVLREVTLKQEIMVYSYPVFVIIFVVLSGLKYSHVLRAIN